MPKRRVTGLSDWIGRFDATPIERQQIEALFEGRDPIYTLENASIILGALDANLSIQQIVNTSGEITEENSAQIATNTNNTKSSVQSVLYRARYAAHPVFGYAAENDAASINASRRIGATNITLVGGVVTNVELVPALAGYTGYIMPYALWASDDDEYALVFQDEDGAALNPTNCDTINVQIKHDNEISPIVQTHGAAGDNSGSSASNILFYGIADNKALEIDVSGGAGAETLVLYYEYWYET